MNDASQIVRRDQAATMVAGCGAHSIQDGLVALQYVVLPIIAQTLGLNYAQVGMLRSVSTVAMSIFEIPSGLLAERVGEARLLAAGLVCAGAGYVGVALSPSFVSIAICFFIAGTGAGFQHALASALLVRRFEGAARRRALGAYNASGDAGKLAFTGLFSAALGAGLAWNTVVLLLAAAAVVFGVLVPRQLAGRAGSIPRPPARTTAAGRWGIRDRRGFTLLGVAVCLDSIVQTAFLTFIGFVMISRGAAESTAALAVVITLAGGMFGKSLCGSAAARFGDRRTFIFIQLASLAGIAAVIALPAPVLLFILPAVGLAIQGSTTVTYGSAAEFLDADRQSRGYALIYSLSGISSVAGPLLFGFAADGFGLDAALGGVAAVTALTLPLARVLAGPEALATGQGNRKSAATR